MPRHRGGESHLARPHETRSRRGPSPTVVPVLLEGSGGTKALTRRLANADLGPALATDVYADSLRAGSSLLAWSPHLAEVSILDRLGWFKPCLISTSASSQRSSPSQESSCRGSSSWATRTNSAVATPTARTSASRSSPLAVVGVAAAVSPGFQEGERCPQTPGRLRPHGRALRLFVIIASMSSASPGSRRREAA